MADKCDPYREALVLEEKTIWPDELSTVSIAVDPCRRSDLEKRLHAEPAQAKELEYVRLPTGFCRQITVTAEDIERLKGAKV